MCPCWWGESGHANGVLRGGFLLHVYHSKRFRVYYPHAFSFDSWHKYTAHIRNHFDTWPAITQLHISAWGEIMTYHVS